MACFLLGLQLIGFEEVIVDESTSLTSVIEESASQENLEENIQETSSDNLDFVESDDFYTPEQRLEVNTDCNLVIRRPLREVRTISGPSTSAEKLYGCPQQLDTSREQINTEALGYLSESKSSFVSPLEEASCTTSTPAQKQVFDSKQSGQLLQEDLAGQCKTQVLPIDYISTNQRCSSFVNPWKGDSIAPGSSSPAQIGQIDPRRRIVFTQKLPIAHIGLSKVALAATGAVIQTANPHSNPQQLRKLFKQSATDQKTIKAEAPVSLVPDSQGGSSTAGPLKGSCTAGKFTPIKKPSKQSCFPAELLKVKNSAGPSASSQNVHSSGLQLSKRILKHPVVGQNIKTSLGTQLVEGRCNSSSSVELTKAACTTTRPSVLTQNRQNNNQQLKEPLKQPIDNPKIKRKESPAILSVDQHCSLAAGPSKEVSTNTEVFASAQHQYFSPQHLEELLKQTIIGQNLIKRASVGPLSADSQRELTQIIIDHHCNAGKRGREEYLSDYAKSIVALFKHEKIVEEEIQEENCLTNSSTSGKRSPKENCGKKLIYAAKKLT
ncbi:uncharacterized protein LOC134207329 [Armigeres subalbatus]|uniref:uncharacterized protein LOC134207329 n=1 Tax=Armigeres subalbatus TaxID=124917 RepID=UPI002ED5F511